MYVNRFLIMYIDLLYMYIDVYIDLLWHGLDVPHVWDIWGGFISLTSIPDISTALMRPSRPKQYCLQLDLLYVCM